MSSLARKFGLAIVGLVLSASGVSANTGPKPFQADYAALRNGEQLGMASIRFLPTAGGRYELLTITRGTEGLAAAAGVSIEERSLLDFRSGRPETSSYRYFQKMAWKSRERRIDVDARAGTVLRSDKDGGRSFAYVPGVLDRHAVTIALMQDLSVGKSGELEYPVAERDGIATQHYRAHGVETIETALGRQRVVRVARVRHDGSGRETTIWFAVDRGHVPLRILQVEKDGESIELRISAIR